MQWMCPGAVLDIAPGITLLFGGVRSEAFASRLEPRPHTAASTANAGANALALGQALRRYPKDIDAALKEWEPDQLSLGRHLERAGKDLGNRSQFC
jgi:hypothetical protein